MYLYRYNRDDINNIYLEDIDEIQGEFYDKDSMRIYTEYDMKTFKRRISDDTTEVIYYVDQYMEALNEVYGDYYEQKPLLACNYDQENKIYTNELFMYYPLEGVKKIDDQELYKLFTTNTYKKMSEVLGDSLLFHYYLRWIINSKKDTFSRRLHMELCQDRMPEQLSVDTGVVRMNANEFHNFYATESFLNQANQKFDALSVYDTSVKCKKLSKIRDIEEVLNR